jgi:hypothetical protein
MCSGAELAELALFILSVVVSYKVRSEGAGLALLFGACFQTKPEGWFP